MLDFFFVINDQNCRRGGGRKNIWGAQINFTLIFGTEDQKRKKGLCGAKVLLGGARSLPARVQWNLMVWFLLLAHKFRGENQKKGLWRDILISVLAFARVFCPRTYFYSRWGGTSSILGGPKPQNTLQGHQAYYFLSGHIPRFGGTLLAWGDTSSDLREHGSKIPLMVPGLTPQALYSGVRPKSQP